MVGCHALLMVEHVLNHFTLQQTIYPSEDSGRPSFALVIRTFLSMFSELNAPLQSVVPEVNEDASDAVVPAEVGMRVNRRKRLSFVDSVIVRDDNP